jgi:zinc protease
MRSVFTLFLIFLATPLWAATAGVHEHRLANGLKVLVKEDHRAPVVITQIWYRVGSSYEHDGITGLSHVLEHMMFKGTEKHGPGEFSRIVAAQGGSENAFTSRDYTAYYQKLAADRLELALELEADRMRNLTLPEEEFGKELRVVMEERRMRTEDKPQGLTYEQFNALSWNHSPYGQPVIGWMDDLEHMSVADLRAWYRAWYAPNNATLVVVGDVRPEQVFRLAERYFGAFEAEHLPALKPRTEPAQHGPRRVVVRVPARLPYLIMGYKVPSLVTAGADAWEPYALEVLAELLDGGDSARLARFLVRGGEVAAAASAGYDLYARLQTQLLLSAVPASGHTIEEVEKALREQVRRLREEEVAPEELARVKAQVVADAVFERDSMYYRAMQIGELETVGLSWRQVEEYVPRVRAVTAAQVREVARRYLLDDRLNVAVLEPQPSGEAEEDEK